MKITVYELLGLIKDGKAPNKIKVTGTIYEYDEEFGFYFTKTKNGKVALGGKLNEINLIYNFNSENNVEILEEENKIPEKLGACAYEEGEIAYSWSKSEALLKTKINEIIDYLKNKGE
ncbi:MAG: hypothetical protein IJ105_01300 [Bacilli bacterium]|nr:hypothetical protein [Bacilli bacterium]